MKSNYVLKHLKEYSNSDNYHLPEAIELNNCKQNKSFDTNSSVCSKKSFDPNFRHNYRYRLQIHNTINLNDNEYQIYDQFRNSELPNLLPIVNKSLRSIAKSTSKLNDLSEIQKANSHYNYNENYNVGKQNSVSFNNTIIKINNRSSSYLYGSPDNQYKGRNKDTELLQISKKDKNLHSIQQSSISKNEENITMNKKPINNQNELNFSNSSNSSNFLKFLNDSNGSNITNNNYNKVTKAQNSLNHKNSQALGIFENETTKNYHTSKVLGDEDYFGNQVISKTFNDSLNNQPNKLRIPEDIKSISEYNSQFSKFSNTSKKLNPRSFPQHSNCQISNKWSSEKALLNTKKLGFLKESILSKTEFKLRDEEKSDESDIEHLCVTKNDKLLNRTIFKFDVNSYSNENIRLKRLRSKTFINSERKIKESYKKFNKVLNPIIQKHNFEVSDKRRNSIKVYLNSKNNGKQQQIGSLIRLKEFKEFFIKSKERELPAIIERIRKFLNLQKQNFLFDLSSFSIDKLDQTDFFVLYFALSRALQPTFYSITDQDFEINQIESDILNLVKNPKQFSSFDSEILKKYNTYVKQSQDGLIFTGFWITKKEDSEVPACRESGTALSQDHKVFLFGGFSNVPLNDLWVLETYDNNLITWIQKPSCPKLDPRYGHCMGYYKNSVYIMFGIGEMMKKIKTRCLFNDVWSFNFEGNMWNKIEPKGLIPERRAYCAYCVIDNLLLIHGGNQGNRRIFFDEIIGFHLDKSIFCEMYSNHKNNYEGLEKMAFHTAVAVLPSELKNHNELYDYWTSFHKWKHLDSSPIPVI